jgi:hypothetical protein
MSMWLNGTYGDCVTAEEAFTKACHHVKPEIFITDETVKAWATKNGVLDGTDLTTVLQLMQNDGFSQDGKVYNDGKYFSVDWTNASVLRNAISRGPVKIGVAAAQLESAVPNPPTNGWIATGFQPDSNMDHCVSLCGFGPMGWLATELGSTWDNSLDGSTPALALYTWDSIGIVDYPSMLAITGEAWLRTPPTVIQ